jgi:hypothetical protein
VSPVDSARKVKPEEGSGIDSSRAKRANRSKKNFTPGSFLLGAIAPVPSSEDRVTKP